ncbi:MAG: hypothetical protein ABL899_00935 [Nitrospira sp.]
MKYNNLKKGSLLVQALVFGSISVVIIGGLISWAGINIKASRLAVYREQALQISEAGIDYYRWHLAHNSTDYQDGTGHAGPYVHDFYDKDDIKIGTFTLTITPPLIGSTLVNIQSDGKVLADPTVVRKIKVRLGIPSLAKYAYVTNSVVYYGAGDEIFGPVHSNSGVGFWNGNPKPIAHNVVSSALATFVDNIAGCSGTHFGVFTCVPASDPAPPAAVPNRPDVFMSGRQFPVPVIDFTTISADLSLIKASAIANGYYRAASGGLGYKVVLKANDTFDVYKVVSFLPVPNNQCKNNYAGGAQAGWGTWSINTVNGSTVLLASNVAFPANGLMFFEDNVWVEGTINTARLTIGAGVFPVNVATYKNIIVNNDLKYTNFDGSDAIGLIAQGNFLVGMASLNDLTIDGAIIAQNGQTIRYYYSANCAPWTFRTTLRTYGMLASNGQGYFYYGNSGYQNQPSSYDPNFLYGPPPSFPLTSDQYQIISWTEVQ